MQSEISQESQDESTPLEDKGNSVYVSAEYSPHSVYVPQGYSLQESLQNEAPQLERGWRNPNVGGAKLIAEMSADAVGINTSRCEQNCYINILPLHMLKLRICDDAYSLYTLIYTNVVSIDMCQIDSYGFFSDFTVKIQITNKTGKDVVVNIPQGQMIEAENEDVQKWKI